MIKLVAALFVPAFLVGVTSDAQSKGSGRGGSHSVRAYTTKKGVYVPPHHATNPNNTKLDNWSTRGSVNPYTGIIGTKPPY
jgi:hypothetical protein